MEDLAVQLMTWPKKNRHYRASEGDMNRPLLLDLFCGAGGAAMGYYRAGFDVVGVDIKSQPRYPFRFVQGDALAPPVRLDAFSAIHASPPCQKYSPLAVTHPGMTWPDLLQPTRDMLLATRLPFIIENVERAPLAHRPCLDGTWGIVLCGSMFGLGIKRGFLRRHRAFETNMPLEQPSCSHGGRRAVGVYGQGGNNGKHHRLNRRESPEAMGIDWMDHYSLTQAIPPRYTEFIGKQVIRIVEGNNAPAPLQL